MPRKSNYEFERRERARLKEIRMADKAAAKKLAKEAAKANVGDRLRPDPTPRAP